MALLICHQGHKRIAMQRELITPRTDWERKLKEQGFVYYKDYYNESAAYSFTAQEVDNIEKATNEIFEMCLRVVQHVIDNDLLDEFFIPQKYADLIKWSWAEDMPSFYGRFDLVYGKDGSIKLLEFNADTPTSLLEASVIQWYWLQEFNKNLDQFNSLHERLVKHMSMCKPYFYGNKKLFFACVKNSNEDFMNTKYLQDCANQALIDNSFIYMDDIGLNTQDQFCTSAGEPIGNIFKLYPYEWLFYEEFGPQLCTTKDLTMWIEPAYKAILSNKMLLVYLHKLYPDSPYILPAFFDDASQITGDYVKKPVFSREGANVDIVIAGGVKESTPGDYGEEGFVYQQYAPIPDFDGNFPVIGSWLIGGEAGGMGIRESKTLITGNMSMFCPHYFK